MKPAQQYSKHGISQADVRYLFVVDWLGFHGHMRALISFFFFPSFLESPSPQILAILLNFCPPQFNFPSGETPLGCNTVIIATWPLLDAVVIIIGDPWHEISYVPSLMPSLNKPSPTSVQNSRELVQNSLSRSVFSIPALPPYPKQWKGSLHVFLRYPASFAPSFDSFDPVCFWIEYLLNQRLR